MTDSIGTNAINFNKAKGRDRRIRMQGLPPTDPVSGDIVDNAQRISFPDEAMANTEEEEDMAARDEYTKQLEQKMNTPQAQTRVAGQTTPTGKEKGVKQRGRGTQLINNIRNRKKIAQLKQQSQSLRQGPLPQKQKELEKIQDELKPLESKIGSLKRKNWINGILIVVCSVLALLLAITIILFPAAVYMFGVVASRGAKIGMNIARIKVLRAQISPIKKKEEQAQKEVDAIQKQIKQTERDIQLYVNQSLLSRRPQQTGARP